MHRNHFILTLLALLIYSSLKAQPLPRKGSFDIKFRALDEALAEKVAAKSKNGLLVINVLGGGTFEAAGIKPRDIITEVNGFEIKDPGFLKQSGINWREGEKITLKVEREGQLISLKSKVVGKARESSTDYDVIYGSTRFKSSNLSTITTKPKGEGPFPSIFFIPGYNCISLDKLNSIHPYAKLIDQFTRMGYLVHRIEKPGMGDSEGSLQCEEIDFPTEVEVFKTGYQDMLKQNDVDTSNTYIFGHSLGGYVAPFISAKYPVKGVMVYGTANGNWHEYLLQMVRFQNPRFGEDYVKVEEDMKLYWKLFEGLSMEDRSPKELVQENPTYERLLKTALLWDGDEKLLGRTYRFNNSIDDLNTTKAWSETKANVLVMYGEADFEAIDPRASKEIVEIVNHYHPGKGTYQFIEETDHLMVKAGTMKEAIELKNSKQYIPVLKTNFNHEIAKTMDFWIKNL
ncbi:MAG: PDZ domain-containing protein [Vicingaceae bacterium]